MPLLGNRIALARQRAGYRTQGAFAEALGVSRGLVGQWESHNKRPGRDNLLKIAELCGITAEYLAGTAPETRTVANLSDREIDHILALRRLPSHVQDNIFDLTAKWGDRTTVPKKKRHPV